MSFYSNTTCEKRTNENFRSRIDPLYHHYESPLEKSPNFDIVKQVVNDPFHLLFLGVTKNLLAKWFGNGKTKGIFDKSLMLEISRNLNELNK